MAAPTLTQPAAGKAGDAAAKAPVQRNAFVRGAREHVEPFHDKSTQMVTSAVQVGPVDVPAFGFLRYIHLYITASGGNDAGPNAAFAGIDDDGAYDALQNITLSDVNGQPIVGPLDGHDLRLINLYGGYSGIHDQDDDPFTNSVDDETEGNFTRHLVIPVEINARDGFGALPNMVSSATYKLSYDIAADSTVYSTIPDAALPSIRVRALAEAWTQPGPADAFGVPNEQFPPLPGTTQYWTRQLHNVSAGDQTITLARVGNLIRNIILVWYNDASPSVRNTTDLPDSLRFQMDGRIEYNAPLDWFHTRRQALFHDLRNDQEGVVVLPYCHDFGRTAGAEMYNLYLPTTRATRLELIGSFDGAGTLRVLTNDVAPRGATPPAA